MALFKGEKEWLFIDPTYPLPSKLHSPSAIPSSQLSLPRPISPYTAAAPLDTAAAPLDTAAAPLDTAAAPLDTAAAPLDTAVDLLEFDLLEQKFPDDLDLEALLYRLVYGVGIQHDEGADSAFERYRPALAYAVSAGIVRRSVVREGDMLFVPGGSPHQVSRLLIESIDSLDER
jgi:hypothetical protein